MPRKNSVEIMSYTSRVQFIMCRFSHKTRCYLYALGLKDIPEHGYLLKVKGIQPITVANKIRIVNFLVL